MLPLDSKFTLTGQKWFHCRYLLSCYK